MQSCRQSRHNYNDLGFVSHLRNLTSIHAKLGEFWNFLSKAGVMRKAVIASPDSSSYWQSPPSCPDIISLLGAHKPKFWIFLCSDDQCEIQVRAGEATMMKRLSGQRNDNVKTVFRLKWTYKQSSSIILEWSILTWEIDIIKLLLHDCSRMLNRSHSVVPLITQLPQ